MRVYDFSIDMEPERYLCLLRYADRPGAIGRVGTVLGAADINIASIKVARETIGGEALMGLTVDSPIPPGFHSAFCPERAFGAGPRGRPA